MRGAAHVGGRFLIDQKVSAVPVDDDDGGADVLDQGGVVLGRDDDFGDRGLGFRGRRFPARGAPAAADPFSFRADFGRCGGTRAFFFGDLKAGVGFFLPRMIVSEKINLSVLTRKVKAAGVSTKARPLLFVGISPGASH